ncbi:MAG: GGDEF domain-containing protein [Actinomycetota bacterium]|nr:GGDEF domain-containing protein [Actinomycetota bacterium]
MLGKAYAQQLPAADVPTMARWLSHLFLAGGAFTLLALLALPLPPGSDTTGSVAVGIGALALGGAVMAARRRLPRWGIPLLVALGIALVSTGTYFWGPRPTDDAMFYVWIAIYAACFFGRGLAAAQLGIIGLAYGAVLVAQGAGEEGSTRWAVTMTTLVVAVTVTSLLVRQLRRAVADRERLMAQLETAALTDELTGLPNRRAWELEASREVIRARRDDSGLCVALLDLDHFKAYNDRHGHRAGDGLLQAAAVAWRDQLRGADVLARYGGEEFAVLLPGCDANNALDLVERLRAATPSPRTVSAGVAVWDGTEPPTDLLDRADAALYEAKASGRDRALLAPAPTPTAA